MRGKIVVCALVFSGAVVSMAGSGSIVEAQRGSATGAERSVAKAVGASISHPKELRFMRDDYTYDGTYGYTLYEPETRASEDHGPQPAIRVARDPGMDPDRIEAEVQKTLDEYSGELDLSRQNVKVGERGSRAQPSARYPARHLTSRCSCRAGMRSTG